jgi:hypothetical protein
MKVERFYELVKFLLDAFVPVDVDFSGVANPKGGESLELF